MPTPGPTPGAGGRIYAPPVLPGSQPQPQPPVSAAPAPTPAPVEPAPQPPVTTTLGAQAVAALPFTVELPQGFRITTGRPGPDFNVYSIRRGDEEFAMVYVGPSSQFPIYDGQMVQAGGRASIVVTENGQRHAMEHLFQRARAPKEIHVWVSSLEGADELLAERIAQSVDAK